jgi:hypothetical protein
LALAPRVSYRRVITPPSARARPAPRRSLGPETGLTHYADAHDRLAAREVGDREYAALLEQVVGVDVDAALVSTSEHTAPFNLASTVSFVLPQLTLQELGLRPRRPLLVLAGSLVPLDNSHYPRGFLLPTEGVPPGRLNLHPQRVRKDAVALTEAVTPPGTPDAAAFVERFPFLRPAFERPAAYRSYAHQLSECMERIAREWYRAGVLVVRPLEDVAATVLAELLERRDAVLERALFDEAARRRLLRRLDGVFGAWAGGRGTVLFWGRDATRVERLRDAGERLVGERVSVPLRREAIAEALRARRVFPGVFLSLLAVSYLPGVPIAGGPRQLTYYVAMIRALDELGPVARDTSLSVYAYKSVELEGLRLSGDRRLPPFGAGLALAETELDAAGIAGELERAPVIVPSRRTARYE